VLINALAIDGTVSLALSAFELLRQPGVPLASGYASLLVPGNPYAPTDQFRLDLVMKQPASTYIEYHVTAGWGTRARHVLLVLSGDTRLADPKYASSTGAVISQRTAELSQPWFPVPVHAEVFDIPIRGMPCPRWASPGQIGSAAAIGGWILRPFEVSANSAHALQLPVIGDEVSADAYAPSLHGYWAAPTGLTVDANAGATPLYDRIDIARPDLTGSGGLTWSTHSYIIPSATWTDESASGRNQLWILLIGAMIGIIGAIPAPQSWTRSATRQAGEPIIRRPGKPAHEVVTVVPARLAAIGIRTSGLLPLPPAVPPNAPVPLASLPARHRDPTYLLPATDNLRAGCDA